MLKTRVEGGHRETRSGRRLRRGRTACRPRDGRNDPDDRHRQQRRHDPHAGPDQRIHQGEPGHFCQMGDARGKRAAPARHHRYRHQGWPIRRADHRHLRGSDLGQEGLAGTARQSRRRLRRRRPAAEDQGCGLRRRQALCRAVLRRELDDHVPHRPVREGRPEDAGEADLGVRDRCRQEADRQERRRLRHLPARQGRLGREHGLPLGDGQFLRRALVRREVAAAVQHAGMEDHAHDLRQI
ncbi:hypothetical protein ACVWYH_000243 [Bradyrhizobium sp. GM24.11]